MDDVKAKPTVDPDTTGSVFHTALGDHGLIPGEAAARLVGEWRRFGRYGPRYQVLSIESDTEAKIKVHTSGEIAFYPISDLLADPED